MSTSPVVTETVTSVPAPVPAKVRAAPKSADERRKAIEAKIEKLKAQLNATSTALAVEINPALAALQARLKAVKSELAGDSRILALREKGLKTLLGQVAETRKAIDERRKSKSANTKRVKDIESEIAEASAAPAETPAK